jgi:hypothetical protein
MRFPGPSPLAGCTTDPFYMDWVYKVHGGLIVQDGLYAVWNGNASGQGTGGGSSGYTKSYKPTGMGPVYVHLVVGDTMYQGLCNSNNFPVGIQNTYDGIMLDEIVPDYAQPGSYVWLAEAYVYDVSMAARVSLGAATTAAGTRAWITFNVSYRRPMSIPAGSSTRSATSWRC